MNSKINAINPFDGQLKLLFKNRKKQRIQDKYKVRHFYDRTASIAL